LKSLQKTCSLERQTAKVAVYGKSLEQLLLDGIKDIAYAPALEVGTPFPA
jgi:hypothetical protein